MTRSLSVPRPSGREGGRVGSAWLFRVADGAVGGQDAVDQGGVHRGVNTRDGAVGAVAYALSREQDGGVQGLDHGLGPVVWGDGVQPAADHQYWWGAGAGERLGDTVPVRRGPQGAAQRVVGGPGADPLDRRDDLGGSSRVRGDVGWSLPVG